MQKNEGGPPKRTSSGKKGAILDGLVLEGVVALLAGTDLDDVLHIGDEDLAIADVAGVEDLPGSVDHQGDGQLADHDGHLHAGQHGGFHLGTAEVALSLAPLLAAAHNVGGGHAGDADVEHGPLERVEPLHLAQDVDLGHLHAAHRSGGLHGGGGDLHGDGLLDGNVAGSLGRQVGGGVVIDKGEAAVSGGQAVFGDVQAL